MKFYCSAQRGLRYSVNPAGCRRRGWEDHGMLSPFEIKDDSLTAHKHSVSKVPLVSVS